MAGLFPPNGATGQTPNPLIRMEFCGMTELELNYFNLKDSGGNVVETVTKETGTYWATIEPNIPLVDGVTYSVEADGRINDSGTIKAIAPGTWEFTTAVPDVDTLYSNDFEGSGYSPPHQLTASQASNLVSGGTFHGAQEGRVHLVDDPSQQSDRGDVLRMDYKTGFIGSQDTGGQCQINVTDKDELYLAFDIYFPANYIFPFTQKLVALMGGGHNSSGALGTQVYAGFNLAGNNPDVIRIISNYPSPGSPITNIDGRVDLYTYYATRKQHHEATTGRFIKGQWNRCELHVKNNTDPGLSDGELHAWLDGQPVYSNTGKKWISSVSPSLEWEELFLHFYVGGSTLGWQHAQDQSIYIDNIIVSENPITH